MPPTGAAGAATPQAKKLGVQAGGHLLLVHPPAAWAPAGLPEGATSEVVAAAGGGPATGGPGTVVLAFFRAAADYLDEVATLARCTFPDGSVWIAWPRRAGGHDSDLTDVLVRDAALAEGLVDNKVAAIDEDWSGLRFTWRRELRGGRPAGAGG